MKLTFFLIAIGLILLRLSYPRLEMWHNGRDQGTMITKGDNYIEGIWWSGKYRLSDDDRTIAEISPGGHLKFRENDTIMNAESDLQGRITYTLNDGREELPMNDSGRNFIAAQIQKMIRLGFFGEQRAERIYQQGGVPALLAELSRIKIEGGRDPYLNRLLRADTLTTPQRIELLRLVDNSNNSIDQQHFLGLIPREQLRDSAVAQEWLKAVGHIDASYMKKDLLNKYIDSSLPADRFDTVLAITSRFRSEPDQQDLYKNLVDLPQVRMHDSAYAQPWLRAVGQLGPAYMKKDLLLQYLDRLIRPKETLPIDQFDTVLAIAGRFESPEDQKEILQKLIGLPPTTDAEWSGLIRATGALQADYIKSDLLPEIASKMPRTDSLRAAYQAAAKSIQSDNDYGKVMRAIE
ncbi:MAG TPA: hypothetical protein VNV35_11815 [Puia sp.]|jgi:hypothetical protein|nr:hypothetical protein [Puia sp.]